MGINIIGQMGAAKIQAKDLVRTRRYIEKFYGMRTQLQAVGLRIQVCFLFFYTSHSFLYFGGLSLENEWKGWRS